MRFSLTGYVARPVGDITQVGKHVRDRTIDCKSPLDLNHRCYFPSRKVDANEAKYEKDQCEPDARGASDDKDRHALLQFAP